MHCSRKLQTWKKKWIPLCIHEMRSSTTWFHNESQSYFISLKTTKEEQNGKQNKSEKYKITKLKSKDKKCLIHEVLQYWLLAKELLVETEIMKYCQKSQMYVLLKKNNLPKIWVLWWSTLWKHYIWRISCQFVYMSLYVYFREAFLNVIIWICV